MARSSLDLNEAQNQAHSHSTFADICKVKSIFSGVSGYVPQTTFQPLAHKWLRLASWPLVIHSSILTRLQSVALRSVRRCDSMLLVSFIRSVSVDTKRDIEICAETGDVAYAILRYLD